jgi:hypothetical protein
MDHLRQGAGLSPAVKATLLIFREIVRKLSEFWSGFCGKIKMDFRPGRSEGFVIDKEQEETWQRGRTHGERRGWKFSFCCSWASSSC